MISALIKIMPHEETNTRTQGEGHVNMKAEVRVVLLLAKGHKIASKPPEATGESWSRFSPQPSE